MSLYLDNSLKNIFKKVNLEPESFLSFGTPYGESRDHLYASLDPITGFVVVSDETGKVLSQGKPSATIRKWFYPFVADLIPDTVFEDISNEVKAELQKNSGTIEVWEVDRILDAYHEKRYAWDTNIGSLGSSCMRHENVVKQVEWYQLLGEGVVQLAVLTRNSDKKILGRALIWNLADGTRLVDRAYGTDATRQMFANFAREQGMWKRRHDTFDRQDAWIDPAGKVQKGMVWKINVPRDRRIVEVSPFVDTFWLLRGDTATLYNHSTNEDWPDFAFQTTIGYPEVTAENFKKQFNAIGENNSNWTSITVKDWFALGGDVLTLTKSKKVDIGNGLKVDIPTFEGLRRAIDNFESLETPVRTPQRRFASAQEEVFETPW